MSVTQQLAHQWQFNKGGVPETARKKAYPDTLVVNIDGALTIVKKVIVHRFSLLFLDTLDEPSVSTFLTTKTWQEWIHSEHGQWLRDHMVGDAVLHSHMSLESSSIMVAVEAKLTEQDAVIHALKWA